LSGKHGAGNTSDEIVMEAAWALCEFSLLVSQQKLSDPSLTAPDHAIKGFYQKKGIF
jgi:hypothetical protein